MEHLYSFNVTMQNHGEYSDTYDNFTPDITVEGECGKVHTFEPVFIACQTFRMRALEKRFPILQGEADEKTIVVFFGDHQ